MNLTKLGWSSWIIILNLVLLLALFIQLTSNGRGNGSDSFINYPQQVNPSAPVKSDPAVNTANNNYASLMLFLQKNPVKSTGFLADIKSKFFDDSCTVKNNIDFPNLAAMPRGMPFSS